MASSKSPAVTITQHLLLHEDVDFPPTNSWTPVFPRAKELRSKEQLVVS